MRPHDCACDVGTIDYTLVDEGSLTCKDCGRTWELTDTGWKANPLSTWKPGSTPPKREYKPYKKFKKKGTHG